jgi:hypothetical protein
MKPESALYTNMDYGCEQVRPFPCARIRLIKTLWTPVTGLHRARRDGEAVIVFAVGRDRRRGMQADVARDHLLARRVRSRPWPPQCMRGAI